MKDSGIEWIGEIPEEWETFPLKRIFVRRDIGAWGSESKENENDLICIRVADFDFSKLCIKSPVEYTVRNFEAAIIDRIELQSGDILIEKSGGGDLTPVGRVVGFSLNTRALYANFIERLRPSEEFYPQYVLYLLAMYYHSGITKKYIKQTTGIQNLDLRSLLCECMGFPPRIDQQYIANYLDNKCSQIDSIIEKQKLVIEKLKQYKQSIITEAVTKGLDLTVKMKPSGIEWIGDIPEGWEICSFKNIIALVIDNRGKTPPLNEEGIPLMEIDGLSGKYASIANVKKFVSQDTFNTFLRQYLKSGDILFATVGSIGKIALVQEEFQYCIAQNIVGFRIVNGCNNFFWYYYMQSDAFRLTYMQYNKGNIQDSIKISNLMHGKIVVPPIVEQNNIAAFLDVQCTQVDVIINGKQKTIDKLTDYKKSLIYECVTGKREVV